MPERDVIVSTAGEAFSAEQLIAFVNGAEEALRNAAANLVVVALNGLEIKPDRIYHLSVEVAEEEWDD